MKPEGVASSNVLGIGTTINRQIFNRETVGVTSSDTDSKIEICILQSASIV